RLDRAIVVGPCRVTQHREVSVPAARGQEQCRGANERQQTAWQHQAESGAGRGHPWSPAGSNYRSRPPEGTCLGGGGTSRAVSGSLSGGSASPFPADFCKVSRSSFMCCTASSANFVLG